MTVVRRALTRYESWGTASVNGTYATKMNRRPMNRRTTTAMMASVACRSCQTCLRIRSECDLWQIHQRLFRTTGSVCILTSAQSDNRCGATIVAYVCVGLVPSLTVHSNAFIDITPCLKFNEIGQIDWTFGKLFWYVLMATWIILFILLLHL